MTYHRINTLTGWAVFAVSLLVYLLTVAPTASFWDCGEFIACANELEVTHPPGAPLFLLTGRIFALLSAGNPAGVAFMVNLVSVFAGAFTALFTCWITTMLARKGLERSEWEEPARTWAGMAAGIVAGLACTFADSVWFNSVEAEVYSMSSFFTAIVVWLMLKWEARADEPDHLRWILLISYVMGLSTGVHLLNLLAIPALALVYYFRKFSFSWPGLLAALGISVLILLVIQYGVLQYTFRLAWEFEKFFTGTVTREGADRGGLGLPIGTGSAVLALLIFGLLTGLIWYSQRSGRVVLNTAVLSLTLLLAGFSSYSLIFVRSQVNPPIDMNNPENVITFLSYMRREQYGDRPLVHGPLYHAQVKRDSRGYPVSESEGMKYMQLEGQPKYVEDTEDLNYVYDEQATVWFPRMHDPAKYNAGPFGYVNYVRRKGSDAQSPYDDRPTKLEDWTFFFDYQVNHMYLRYFLWNFVGRESDIQESRWESGLEFWDASRSRASLDGNKGKNHFFFIPLLLGLFGLTWQSMVRRQDAGAVGLLFLFTGLAIIVYLNQTPLQPRERDYSYAGSIQTFCIWVGLGVLFIAELLRKFLGQRAVWAAAALGLTAPLLMAVQGWDDHTRKGRWIDIEFAKNLLDSCAPNAILFTGGDNDTFPLWYVQEVENYRSDVRVVNLELLVSDWYIDQMKEPKNQAEALPLSMRREQYAGDEHLVIYGYPSRTIRIPVDRQALVAEGVLTAQEAAWAADTMVWNFRANGSGQNSYILRKDSVMLDLIRNVAADNWRRPVYFANTMGPSSFAGLQDYCRLEGLAYRVVPVKRSQRTPNDINVGWIAQETMHKTITQTFRYTGLNDPSVNFDDHIRAAMINNYRNCFLRLANTYAEAIFRTESALARADSITGGDAAATRSLLEANGFNPDQVPALQDSIRRLYAIEAQHIPVSVLPKSLPQLLTQLQLLAQAGMDADALALAPQLEEMALQDMEDNLAVGRRNDERQTPVRACIALMQLYLDAGKPEAAVSLADRMMARGKTPIGQQALQQFQSTP
ncbi:MAG: DUF2723 domain-containing protein [Bacteroidia bacterium]|nr:DUF2723 domain-containing protein [Bacteroidia bacterium]